MGFHTGASRRSASAGQTKALRAPQWANIRSFLDTECERWRTNRNKNDEEGTASTRGTTLLGPKIREKPRSGLKKGELNNQPREGVRNSDAQPENDESVLGVAPCLDRVIPMVKHLDKRTDKNSQQD